MVMRTGLPGFIAALLAAALLAGCGFKLRGELDFPDYIRRVQVTAPQALRNDIVTQLESGGIEIADNSRVGVAGMGPDASITVTNERFSRRVLSVDPTTGKEREFELVYALDFRLTRGGRTYIGKETVTLLRDYVFDPQAVIGTGREEELLHDEMRRDAARALMRRVEGELRIRR